MPHSLTRAGHGFRSGLGLAEAFREMDPHRTGEIRFDRVFYIFGLLALPAESGVSLLLLEPHETLFICSSLEVTKASVTPISSRTVISMLVKHKMLFICSSFQVKRGGLRLPMVVKRLFRRFVKRIPYIDLAYDLFFHTPAARMISKSYSGQCCRLEKWPEITSRQR